MNYAIFICTHGRPDKQYTLETLRRCGYTGKIILIVDDEDDTVSELMLKTYGTADDVVKFRKQHYIDSVDIGRSDAKRKAILYAKCACEDVAKERNLDAFVIADDDITDFRFRYDDNGKFATQYISQNMDIIIQSYFEYILSANICMTSFGTNQMFMGGKIPDNRIGDFRIPYNFLFRNTSIPFQWISEMNEDTISIMVYREPYYMIQLPFIKLEMRPLMAGAKGGMTEFYNQLSFAQRIGTIIMYSPSNIKYIATDKKITHSVKRDNAFPKLISSSIKKK